MTKRLNVCLFFLKIVQQSTFVVIKVENLEANLDWGILELVSKLVWLIVCDWCQFWAR